MDDFDYFDWLKKIAHKEMPPLKPVIINETYALMWGFLIYEDNGEWWIHTPKEIQSWWNILKSPKRYKDELEDYLGPYNA